MSGNPLASPWIIVLAGPTATGKTDLAIELASRFPLDIISVDSALVYRGLDIGAAKPPPDVLRAHPHRLIDILEPEEPYSAERFRADALREIAEIHRAGRVPLLAGGTMLYLRALLYGLSSMPAADPDMRAEIEARAAREGQAALHAWLAEVDPQAAARIHPNDPQRVQRALEVYLLTGRALSDLHAEGRGGSLPFRVFRIDVMPDSRAALYERIGWRLGRMFAQGLVEEVERLRARGTLDLSSPSMRAVGYRQVWRFLDGDYDYLTMVEQAFQATRQLAKRQMTWMRSEPEGGFAIQLPGTTDELCTDIARQVFDSN